jgi:hypothetical protein
VIIDACETNAGIFERAWLLAGVAVCGVRERARRRVGKYATPIVTGVATVATASAAFFIFASAGHGGGTLTPTPTLSVHARIGPQFTTTHDLSLAAAQRRREVVLGAYPAGRDVVAVLGPPAVMKLNPRTDQVISIQARSR